VLARGGLAGLSGAGGGRIGGMERRLRRRTLLPAAALFLAGCGYGAAPPVSLVVAGELLPAGPLGSAYRAVAPRVALSFPPWPPGPGASVACLDAARFAPSALRATLVPLQARLGLIAFESSAIGPALWTAFSDGGAPYAVPAVQSRMVVLYDAARLARPAPGWTFSDLLGALAGLRAPALADLAGVRVDVWNALTAARGGDLAGPPGRLPLPAPAAAVAAWQDFGRLQGHAAPGAALGPGGAAAALRFFVRPADVAALQRAGLRVGVAAFPGPAVPTRAWGHGIRAAAPEPGAALQFVAWAGEPLAQLVAARLGFVPAVTALQGMTPALGAAGGTDPAALRPNPRADTFLPAPVRLSATLQAALEDALAAARPGMSPAAAAAAYAAAARRG
jgi:ABC-type glycerol-3-phosphate transport system substrate-binding protein